MAQNGQKKKPEPPAKKDVAKRLKQFFKMKNAERAQYGD